MLNVTSSIKNISSSVVIFLLVYLSSMVLLSPLAFKQYKDVASQALQMLETKVDLLKGGFDDYLQDYKSLPQCSSTVRELRRRVFTIDSVKEAALFRGDFRIYCSTINGDVSFKLYRSITDRMLASPERVTLSYTSTMFSDSKSVVIVFSNHYNQGASILVSPTVVYKHPAALLGDLSIDYKVEIIGRDIHPQPPGDYLSEYTVKSQRYPLNLTAYIGVDYFVGFIIGYSWLALLLASILTIGYLIFKARATQKHSLEFSLANALANGHLQVHYQPIVDAHSSEIVGSEALLRWSDPEEGFVSPAIFIPLAEKTGLIDQLTHYVLAEVLALIASCPSLFEKRYISVNISPKIAVQPAFAAKVIDLFSNNRTVMTSLVFEITEEIECSEKELQLIQGNIDALKVHGIRFAVDDFGTGYAGLDLVRQLDFSILKIDRVFVKNLSNEADVGVSLIESMLLLARKLEMRVVAEGVEHEGQLEVLRHLDVQCIQGFYFYRPMPSSELLQMLGRESYTVNRRLSVAKAMPND